MTDEVRPSIAPIARRLDALDKTPQMVEAVKANPELEDVFYTGYGELIARFNTINSHEPALAIMPGVRNLKQRLKGIALPDLNIINARELVGGISEAREKMVMGQEIKQGIIEATDDNRNEAIGSPSLDTSPAALAIGTASHILERAMFNYFRSKGIQLWAKDEILFALEDLILLKHAEMLDGKGEDSPLFKYISP